MDRRVCEQPRHQVLRHMPAGAAQGEIGPARDGVDAPGEGVQGSVHGEPDAGEDRGPQSDPGDHRDGSPPVEPQLTEIEPHPQAHREPRPEPSHGVILPSFR